MFICAIVCDVRSGQLMRCVCGACVCLFMCFASSFHARLIVMEMQRNTGAAQQKHISAVH